MNLSREVCLTLLDMFVAFANVFPRALKRRDTFELLWMPLTLLMAKHQTLDATLILLETVYHLLPAFKVHFFTKQNSACPELISNTLRHCNSMQLKIRKSALSVLIRVIQANYVACNNIDRFRLQATIAIIRIVGQSNFADFARVKGALSFAAKELLKDDAKAILQPSSSVSNIKTASASAPLSATESTARRSMVGKSLEDLDKKIDTIIADNKKMKEYEYDPETLCDLYYEMSKKMEDSPDERITWLENLAERHKTNQNLLECAQARILTAAYVQAYLKVLGRWDLSSKIVPAFHLVAPNMSEEDVHIAAEHHEALISVKDEVCQSATFSSKGFGNLIAEAIALLKQGGFFESCAAAYRMILPTYYENDNYIKQKECYAELQWLCQQILDENVMKQRIFSNYYRVVVYGAKLGSEVNGVEFVYKELPTMRLMDFSEKMKAQYVAKFGEPNVVLLSNTAVVKPAELDANKVYMQICNVEVYWTQEQLVGEKNTAFKQHFGVDRFVMEQPFVKKKEGEKNAPAQANAFEDQHIRRTVFTTQVTFPHVLKRAKVLDKEETELSPIECAIALIEKRARALKAELSSSTPNMKNIQRELQGGVLTQVNAGPLAVIQTFLNDNTATKSKYNEKSREILADCVSEFERNVAFGIALNKAMLDDNTDATQVTLQEELAKGLERLRAAMAACSIFASRKDARHALDEEQRRQEAERAHRTLGDENTAPVGMARSGSSSSIPVRTVPTRGKSSISKPGSASDSDSGSSGTASPAPKISVSEGTGDKTPTEKRRADLKKAESLTPAKPTVPELKKVDAPAAVETPKVAGELTPTRGAASSGHEQLTPRGRAASAAVRMTMSPEEKAKEREEREKERLAEVKAKAKAKESVRIGGSNVMEQIAAANPSLAGSPRSKSPREEAAPVAAPSKPAPSKPAPVDKKTLRSNADFHVTEIIQRANIMQMSISVAISVEEMGPLVKKVKAIKESVHAALAALPSPPNPTLRPSPPKTEDRVATFRGILTTELENIKIVVVAVQTAMAETNDANALLSVTASLEEAISQAAD